MGRAASSAAPKKYAVASVVVWPSVTWNLRSVSQGPRKKRTLRTNAKAELMPGTDPGAATMPRSIAAASNCERHRPARSPQTIFFTGLRNICMDLTFFSRPTSGSSTISLTAQAPRSAVPVTTVPWPRIGKQWSMAKKKGPSTSRLGMRARRRSVSTKPSKPSDGAVPKAAAARFAAPLETAGGSGSPFWPLPPTAATFSPPTAAAQVTMVALANLLEASWRRMRFVVLATVASRSASGMTSTLLRTMMSSLVVISPMTRHSAVCVWMPLFTSMTSTIMSMICEPPMIVRMSDAWPGQSTSVNCRFASSNRPATPALSWSGSGTLKLLKPRSSVMPRAFDSGALSSAAVDSVVDSALTSDVLPLSTWPMMPTLMLSGKMASAAFFDAMARIAAQRRRGEAGRLGQSELDVGCGSISASIGFTLPAAP